MTGRRFPVNQKIAPNPKDDWTEAVEETRRLCKSIYWQLQGHCNDCGAIVPHHAVWYALSRGTLWCETCAMAEARRCA